MYGLVSGESSSIIVRKIIRPKLIIEMLYPEKETGL